MNTLLLLLALNCPLPELPGLVKAPPTPGVLHADGSQPDGGTKKKKKKKKKDGDEEAEEERAPA